jgi:hypothetical protein
VVEVVVVVVAARARGEKSAIFIVGFFVMCGGDNDGFLDGGIGFAAAADFCRRRRQQRFCGVGGFLS